jgi:MoxR-like ATPase
VSAFAAVEEVEEALAGQAYLADRALALAVFLAATLDQPLLLEGEAGVGKTEVARALAAARGARPPTVVLTSNRTRELHDALKRRCLYHWIDYPAPDRERAIVEARAHGVTDAIARRVCAAVARLRREELYKAPGVGETIVWARALMAVDDLDATLGAVLKVREDVDRVREKGVLEGV